MFFVHGEGPPVEHPNELIATIDGYFLAFHDPCEQQELIGKILSMVLALVVTTIGAAVVWLWIRTLHPGRKVPVVIGLFVVLETLVFALYSEGASRPALVVLKGSVKEFVDRTQGSNRLEIYPSLVLP